MIKHFVVAFLFILCFTPGYAQIFGIGDTNNYTFNENMCKTFINSIPKLSCKNIDIYYGYSNPLGCMDIMSDSSKKTIINDMKMLHDELSKYNINMNVYWLDNNMNQIHYPGSFNYAGPLPDGSTKEKPNKQRVGILARLFNKNYRKENNALSKYRRIAKFVNSDTGVNIFLPVRGIDIIKYVTVNNQNNKKKNICSFLEKSNKSLPRSCIELQFAVGCKDDNMSISDLNNLYGVFSSYVNLYSNKYNTATSLFEYTQPNEIDENFDVLPYEDSDVLRSELPAEAIPDNNALNNENNNQDDHEYVWLLCSAFDLTHEGIAVDESAIPDDQIPEQCKGNK